MCERLVPITGVRQQRAWTHPSNLGVQDREIEGRNRQAPVCVRDFSLSLAVEHPKLQPEQPALAKCP